CYESVVHGYGLEAQELSVPEADAFDDMGVGLDEEGLERQLLGVVDLENVLGRENIQIHYRQFATATFHYALESHYLAAAEGRHQISFGGFFAVRPQGLEIQNVLFQGMEQVLFHFPVDGIDNIVFGIRNLDLADQRILSAHGRDQVRF